MEDLKAKQIVHRVIDNSLSGIQDDPWMAQRILANAKGEEPVVKKISTSKIWILYFLKIKKK